MKDVAPSLIGAVVEAIDEGISRSFDDICRGDIANWPILSDVEPRNGKRWAWTCLDCRTTKGSSSMTKFTPNLTVYGKTNGKHCFKCGSRHTTVGWLPPGYLPITGVDE